MEKTTENNYFIRGTNSTILSLIEKNGGFLSKSVEMAENEGFAPLASELDKKGACRGAIGGKPRIAFGRLWKPSDCPHMKYDLDNVINNYAYLPVRDEKTILKAIDYYCKNPHMIVPMINALLIYVTNANQLSIKYDKDSLMKSLNQGLQYFYFLSIFCLNFDSNLKEKFKLSYFDGIFYIGEIIEKNLNSKVIIKALKKMDIDLKRNYQNDNDKEETIKDVLKCLFIGNKNSPIPDQNKKKLNINSDLEEKKHENTAIKDRNNQKVTSSSGVVDKNLVGYSQKKHLEISAYIEKSECKLYQFFKKKDEKNNDRKISSSNEEYAIFLANKIKSGVCDCYELFEYVLRQTECSGILSIIAREIEPEIREAERLIQVIKNSFTKKCPKISLIDSFPLILLINDNKQFIQPENSRCSEYFSTKPLKLGVDITFLATDTENNAKKLIQWLEERKFYCVVVCLFSELKSFVLDRKKLSFGFYKKNRSVDIHNKFDREVLYRRSSMFRALQLVEEAYAFISKEDSYQKNSNSFSCVSIQKRY